MLNENIINNFKKLIKVIQIETDNLIDKKEIKINTYRILSLKKSLKILSKFNYKIINIEQIKNIKGIGYGTINRVEEILKYGKLKEINKYDKLIKKEKIVEELMSVIGIGRIMALKLINEYKFFFKNNYN